MLFSGVLRGAAGVARHPPGDRRRPHDRPADQLPRLRAVHDLPDPDVLRVRPEAHPRAGLGAQGHRDLRAAAAVARRRPTREPLPEHGDLVDEADRLRGPRGPADRSWSAPSRRTPPRWPTGWAATCPTDTEPVSHDIGEGLKGRAARRARAEREAERARIAARDEERARQPWGVTPRRRRPVARPGWPTYAAGSWSATAAASCSPAPSRTPSTRTAASTADQAEEALRVANAEDVYDALPGGWQGQLDERGRGLSGGQRQRVVLARAIAADAPVLVLVEPTSAVDAHTEARIAERVADVPPRPHDRGHHGLAAVAAPRRPRRAGPGQPRDRRRAPTRTCCSTAPTTAAWSPARWTSRAPAMSRRGGEPSTWLTCSPPRPTPGATAPPTRPSIPRELIPPEEGSFTDRVTALRRRHALRERRALENYAQSRKPDRGWPVADNQAVLRVLPQPAARAPARCSRRWSCSTASPPRPAWSCRACSATLIDRTVAGDAASSLDTAGPADRRGGLRPGAADVPGPADLDGLRPGPAVVGPRVHRPHDPRPAARAGRERQQRRPGHPRHPRRRHDEPLGAVRRPDGDHLRSHRGALDRRDAAQLRRAGRAVAARHRRSPIPQVRRYLAEGPEGLHQRGRDLLPHQQHPDRDRRGRPHGRGARPGRPPGAGRRRRHRHLGAGRALHDDAAQPAVRGHRRGVQRPARGHAAGRRLRLLRRAGSRSARSPRPSCTSRR